MQRGARTPRIPQGLNPKPCQGCKSQIAKVKVGAQVVIQHAALDSAKSGSRIPQIGPKLVFVLDYAGLPALHNRYEPTYTPSLELTFHFMLVSFAVPSC